MSKHRIARLGPHNIHHLEALHKAVYGKTCKQHYYQLKYNTAYTGAEHIGFLAYEQEQPIAFYGAVPVIMLVQKQKVLAAQSCDTMTHPAHRKKGLFIELAKLTFDLAKASGIHFVFGFPNQHSYPGFIKHLGFTHSETMNRYSMRYESSLYRSLYYRLWKARLSKAVKPLTNSLITEGFDGVVYDQAWFDYKQYDRTYTVENTKGRAWIKCAHGLWIGALETGDASKTIRAVVQASKTREITLMVSPGTALDAQLTRMQPAEAGFAIITKNLSRRYDLSKLKFQLADIDIF